MKARLAKICPLLPFALHYFAEISWATDLDDVVNAIRLFASYNPDLTLCDDW